MTTLNKIVKENLGNYVSAFYLAMNHSHEEELVKYLQKYVAQRKVVEYIYAKEVSLTTHKMTDGEHFHFVLFHFSENKKLNLAIANSYIRHFKNKFNLIGKSDGNEIRQYGLIRKGIREVDTIIRYSTKNNNFCCSTKDLEEIVSILPKWDFNLVETPVSFFKAIVDDLKRQPPEILNNDVSIVSYVLSLYRKELKDPPIKSTMDKFLRIIHFWRMPEGEFISKYYL